MLDIHHIHVDNYCCDENGIRIDFKLRGSDKQYHYLVTAEDMPQVLAKIGNCVGDELSQHDAIHLVYVDQAERQTRATRKILEPVDLVGYSDNFFRKY